MAALTKRNSRVLLLDFSYNMKGELTGVTAQVTYEIFDSETETVVTSPVETKPVELTSGTRKALDAILKRLVE